MAWRSLAPIRPDTRDAVQFWLGRDRFFGLCPAGDDITYGFGNLTTARLNHPIAGRKHRLIESFSDFGAPVRDYLHAVEDDSDIHCAPIEWLPKVAWGNGRVVLIRDGALRQRGTAAFYDRYRPLTEAPKPRAGTFVQD